MSFFSVCRYVLKKVDENGRNVLWKFCIRAYFCLSHCAEIEFNSSFLFLKKKEKSKTRKSLYYWVFCEKMHFLQYLFTFLHSLLIKTFYFIIKGRNYYLPNHQSFQKLRGYLQKLLFSAVIAITRESNVRTLFWDHAISRVGTCLLFSEL